MRRRCLFLAASLSLVAAPVGATAAAQPASTTVAPRASLTAFACRRALDPLDRSISVTAVMRPVARTRALSARFDLLERAAGTTRSVAGAGDLGTWLSPNDPTLGRRAGDVWMLNKTVSDLAPARYRFRVTFRWLGVNDTVLATAVRDSAGCTQRELRPDLVVRSVAVTAVPGTPSRQLYTAVIANDGATGAGTFEVLFTPGDGSAPQTHTVARIDAHSVRRVSFVGPVCDAASPATVVADSTDRVDDADRGNNAMTVTCPLQSTRRRR
jgi:hypothetical protein